MENKIEETPFVQDRKLVLDLVSLLEQRLTDTIADKILDKVADKLKDETGKLVQRLEAEISYLNGITYEISNMKLFGLPVGAIFLQRALKQMEKANVKKRE